VMTLGTPTGVVCLGNIVRHKCVRAPNGLELSCPAEAGRHPPIVAHAGGPGTPPYGPARRVSFSESLCENPRIANRVPTHSPSRAAAR
jgi:hypothetical protein